MAARLGVCIPLSMTHRPLFSRPSDQPTASAAFRRSSSKWTSCIVSPVQYLSPSLSRFFILNFSGSIPSFSARRSMVRSLAQVDCIWP
jgi:hypothetical protein